MSKEQGSLKTATVLAAAVGFNVNTLRKSIRSETARKLLIIGTGLVLRYLAAIGYIVEISHDEYQPNNFSMALTLPIIGDPYLL